MDVELWVPIGQGPTPGSGIASIQPSSPPESRRVRPSIAELSPAANGFPRGIAGPLPFAVAPVPEPPRKSPLRLPITAIQPDSSSIGCIRLLDRPTGQRHDQPVAIENLNDELVFFGFDSGPLTNQERGELAGRLGARTGHIGVQPCGDGGCFQREKLEFCLVNPTWHVFLQFCVWRSSNYELETHAPALVTSSTCVIAEPAPTEGPRRRY